ncbi:MAG TPA: SCO family protein [Terriglobales bacterium]|jgi:protein SCO1/2
MYDLSRRKILGLGAMAPFAGSMLNASDTRAAPVDDDAQTAARERIRERYFPNVILRTQDNKKVRFYDDLIKGRIVTINFFYAKCEEVCPLITMNLVKVQKLLGERVGRDVVMNSITLKAETDTPAILKEYQEMHRIGPGWNLLTGEPRDVELLRRSLGFINPDPRVDKDVTQHIGNVRYGNEPLMLWAACPGMAHAEWIAESISWVIRPETKLVKNG